MSSMLRATVCFLLALPTAALAAGPPVARCDDGQHYDAVDLSTPVTEEFIKSIKKIGVKTIIRYYDYPKPNPKLYYERHESKEGKLITADEISMIARNDLSLAVNFQ